MPDVILHAERQQAPEGLRQKPNLDTLRNADQAAELLQRHPVPAASSAQLGSPHPIAGDTATGQAARPHTTNMQTDQHGKADKPPDTIAQPCSQSGRPSDLQAQALASAVGATEKVVQQLSAQEQEDVRSAVAAAAQQVAQQQEQQAAMMNAGQPYPQVCRCCAVISLHPEPYPAAQ